MAELSDRLVEVLNQKGWSQAQLAHELEVSSAAVSGWCSGSKRPTPTNLAAIATRLGVSPSYLQYGDGVAPSMDLGEARRAYRSELEWYWRPAPQDGGRELGNPAGFAFKIDMPTLARESAQNALDERRPGEPTVVMDYTVIELSGAMLDDFLEAIQFNDAVRPHLKAAATTHQKVSAVIANGLRRLDEEGRLVMIRITDNFANGLLGPEYDTGQYMAVIRNILDSFKGENAGGSYGLGKATLWASSEFGLVLVNSTLAEAVDGNRFGRFVGRIELPWHETTDGPFAGPGWLGELDPERAVTRSYWGNDALAKDTYLTRPSDASGTSFLIVGAYDPSGEAETVEEMADQLRRALAQNFWPAMVERGDDAPARLSAIVRAQRNERVITEQFVDPEQFEPAKVAALRHHFADDVTDILSAAGDVVRATVSLKVPRRVAPESEHPAVQHEPIVLVAQADDGDDDANHIAYLRGSHMIVHDPQLSGLPVGAIPFHAIVLAGEAAGATTADRAAERFLRAAEPPAHNRWTSTPDVNAAYARGGPSAIRAMDEEIRKLIRDLVRQPVSEKSDGPESLKELLRLTPPKPEVERRPRVKAAKGQLDDDGTWDVEATISLPPRDRPWSLRPVLRFGTESGPPIPVKWSSLAAVANCEVLDGRLVAEGSARQVRFRGRTDPRSYPVGATRAKILVDVRTDAEESRADIDGEPS